MEIVNFESIESKLKQVVSSDQWKHLQSNFNEKTNILIFGHGGNFAIADHGAIDISRLTNKCAISPGSGVTSTSLISDCGYENWLVGWLDIVMKGLDHKDTIIIGCSCSVGTKSSEAILKALNQYANSDASCYLISARTKLEAIDENITQIITNSIYYHTSEVLTLMLLYQLIHSYTGEENIPPPIRVKCSELEQEQKSDVQNKDVPPGFENELDNLAIDFDGVIHTFDKGFHDGTCYGEPIEGALDAIKSLSKKYNLVVFSGKCRHDRPLVNGLTGKELIVQWLQKHDVMQYIQDVTAEKPRAKYYIDDKGIKFTNNWDEILKDLLE